MVGREQADPGGPVRMVEEFDHALQHDRFRVVKVAMLFGVFVGLFLALPIPWFDGGRLLLVPYRALTRRRSRSTP